MTGETDLAAILATLEVITRAEAYTYAFDRPELADQATATIHETEGPTYVVTVTAADAAGVPVAFRAAWLTISVHTALEGVGLTAALSRALADAGIACNVLAGYHHDHLLVPWERADAARAALLALRDA